jgi:hypothetical protein
VVEVARLESVYRFIAYPGFESPSLRQKQLKAPMNGAFSILVPTFLPTRRFALHLLSGWPRLMSQTRRMSRKQAYPTWLKGMLFCLSGRG